MLEKGAQHTSSDFSYVEGDGFSENYLDHGLIMTESGSLPILAGQGLGGGTTINYSTSFALPQRTREEWSRLSGLSLFTGSRFEESFGRVHARLSISTDWSIPVKQHQMFEDACRDFAARPAFSNMGRTLSYAGASVHTPEGALLAHGTSTLMTLPGKGIGLGVAKFLD